MRDCFVGACFVAELAELGRELSEAGGELACLVCSARWALGLEAEERGCGREKGLLDGAELGLEALCPGSQLSRHREPLGARRVGPLVLGPRSGVPGGLEAGA